MYNIFLSMNMLTVTANMENVDKHIICRDFIWGRCSKGSKCKYRHEIDLEVMKKTLKFCHDFQNSTGCSREPCTFLHATKEEQILFYGQGQLPKVLLERHTIMSAATSERIPQIPAHQECIPPQSAHASVFLPPSTMTAPQMALQNNRQPTIVPIQQLLLPPPPPPPPPPPELPTNTCTPVMQHAPIFTKPVTKRHATNEDVTAQSNKVKKQEVAHPDMPCEQCVQRERLKKEMMRNERDEIYENFMYKKKLEECQSLQEILKSIINTDLIQRYVDDNVEGVAQNNIFNQPSLSTGASAGHKPFVLQLIECVIGDAKNERILPKSIEQTLVQILSAVSGRANPVDPVKMVVNIDNNNNSNIKGNTVLKTFMDILQQLDLSHQSLPPELKNIVNKSGSTCTTDRASKYPQQVPVTVTSNTFAPSSGPAAHVHIAPVVYTPHVPPPSLQAHQLNQQMPPAGVHNPPPYNRFSTFM